MGVLNLRDHRKVCILDGSSAWIGSMNVWAKSVPSLSGKDAWRELGMLVAGQDVSFLKAAYDLMWYPRALKFRRQRRNAKKILEGVKLSSVRLNSTRKFRSHFFRSFIRSINGASKRVWIVNPYFVPPRRLIIALAIAAKRGVDVRVIVSEKLDIFFMPWVSEIFERELNKNGVKVFAYQPSMLHAKYSIIDDFAIIGSSNLNSRSLRHDLEADVIIRSEQTLQKVVAEFEKDLKQSRELNFNSPSKFKALKTLFARFALLFRNYL